MVVGCEWKMDKTWCEIWVVDYPHEQNTTKVTIIQRERQVVVAAEEAWKIQLNLLQWQFSSVRQISPQSALSVVIFIVAYDDNIIFYDCGENFITLIVA
jgi:hypothetical protein